MCFAMVHRTGTLSRSNPFMAQLVNIANCWKWEMDSLMRWVPSWLYSSSPTPRHSFKSPPPPSQDQAPPLPTQQATHFLARSPPSLGPFPPMTLPGPQKLTNNKRRWAVKWSLSSESVTSFLGPSPCFPERSASPKRLQREVAFKEQMSRDCI